MVSTAKITINRTNSSDSNDVDKNTFSNAMMARKVLEEVVGKRISNLTSVISQGQKLTQSGLLGGSTALGIGAGLVAGASSFITGTDIGEAFSNYEKGTKFELDKDGNVNRINETTGDILETIDKQDAIERGILDERGNLKTQFEEYGDIMKRSIENSLGLPKKSLDLVDSVSDFIKSILKGKNEQDKLNEAIRNARKKYSTSSFSGDYNERVNVATKEQFNYTADEVAAITNVDSALKSAGITSEDKKTNVYSSIMSKYAISNFLVRDE